MPTPTGPERKLLAAGAKKGATWGTAVALGAGFGVNIKAHTGFNRVQELLRAEEIDAPLPFSAALDNVKEVEPLLTTDFLYDPGSLGSLIAGLFGTAGAPTQQGGTTAYKHTLQWADTNWGLFFTFASEMPGKIWECASAKPTDWTLKSTGGGIIQSELKLRGNIIIDSSAVNTATQMDALTYNDRDNRVLFRQQVVKMNAQSAGDVTGSTALNCTNVEISFKRQGYDSLHPAGQYDIVEPAEGGYPEIRVKLLFPRFDSVNAAFFATAIAETTQKMLIAFTSAVEAGAGYPYSLKLFFPRLRMLVPEASFEEIVKNGLELIAETASAAPTGMSYTRPYAELINKRTTDYLS
jgi:hypothetical protein